MNIQEYVLEHTERNACRCGKCIVSGEDKDLGKPVHEKWEVADIIEPPHTVNMYFFDVCVRNNPTVEEFVRLTKECPGEFAEVNPLDGQEHGYIELGGWIGDQGLAMQYMALGEMLGLWEVMQPGMILNLEDPQQKGLADQMAGAGLVSILSKGDAAKAKQ